jgi:hypothetical protein
VIAFAPKAGNVDRTRGHSDESTSLSEVAHLRWRERSRIPAIELEMAVAGSVDLLERGDEVLVPESVKGE